MDQEFESSVDGWSDLMSFKRLQSRYLLGLQVSEGLTGAGEYNSKLTHMAVG